MCFFLNHNPHFFLISDKLVSSTVSLEEPQHLNTWKNPPYQPLPSHGEHTQSHQFGFIAIGYIVRASPGCRRPLFKRSVACVTEGVSVVPVVARLRKEDGCSSLRRGLGQANCGLC